MKCYLNGQASRICFLLCYGKVCLTKQMQEFRSSRDNCLKNRISFILQNDSKCKSKSLLTTGKCLGSFEVALHQFLCLNLSFFPTRPYSCCLAGSSYVSSAHQSATVHPSSQTHTASKFPSTGEPVLNRQRERVNVYVLRETSSKLNQLHM